MKSSEASSSPSRSKKSHRKSSKIQSPDPIQLSSKTPEKPPEFSRRLRNRGIALSVKDIRKVAEGLQERNRQQQHHDTTSSQARSARRQISMPSPETTPQKSKSAVHETNKLPEKYEILGEFFDSLDSSIRLLRLKGSMASFTNISPKVECLTDRRFTHGHLAQLKFILPEAIVIKKVLVFDERTSCMKPDLHVTINPDAVKPDAKLLSECGSVSLRKLFRSRLLDFCRTHPEGDEIPEETLPEPFNHLKQGRLSDILEISSPSFVTETSSDACVAHPPAVLSTCMQNKVIADQVEPANIEQKLSVTVETSIEALNQKPAVASHISQSFRRRFSQKSKEIVADNVQKKLPLDSFQPLSFSVSESSLEKNSSFVGAGSHSKTCPPQLASEAASSPASADFFTPSDAPPDTPSQIYTGNEKGPLRSINDMSTPAKYASTPSRLMTVTPTMPTPKRHYMSPDDNASSLPNKLVRRPTRSRSLKFDTLVENDLTENEVDDAGGLSIDDDIFDILPKNLLQSIKEKERMAMEERDPAISQAKRRQKMIASLPKLFNMIHLLFHSINRSVITKDELISKIISSHCDIVDRREVDEQLNLLLELAPEWISEKLASSGDLLLCINKLLNPEILRSSLEEAK